MTKNNTLSLTGKQNNNLHNLEGKMTFTNNSEPLEVQKLKIQILNKIIIPLLNNKWVYLQENNFMIDIILAKIDLFYVKYNLGDLLLYKEFIKSLEKLIAEHDLLVHLENQLYSNCGNNSSATLVYKTTLIKIKPEYEIYNLIYGNPFINNKKYNQEIIKELSVLIKIDNIDFDKIQSIITDKFKNV
jgi:hypothetical protein